MTPLTYFLPLAAALTLCGCAAHPNYSIEHSADYFMEHPEFSHGKTIDCMAAATLEVMREDLSAEKAAVRRSELLSADPQCVAARRSYYILGRAGKLEKITQSEVAMRMHERLLKDPQLTRTLSLQCYQEAWKTIQKEHVPRVYVSNRLEELLASSPRCTLASTAYDELKEKGKIVGFEQRELSGEWKPDAGIGGWGPEEEMDGWDFDKKEEDSWGEDNW
ncbi:hypothetical protein JWG39_10925 [Desulforhopalus vacuolatus]|uniref:hypothetical protein n=1 Tax=Desulforhopalus vacuolatus TaxID=40414 RepID=UPI0019638CA4|nr:hypothetical protein [Desulforhopalus vacuolatus]MBM9520323.1 hypothetical protein [Desulforhopalus vacuolatus]